MPDTPLCLRCGSDAVVPDAHLVDTAGLPVHFMLSGKRPKPKLSLKTLVVYPTLHGAEVRVCSDCGLIELVAADPSAAWDDHLTRTTER